MFDKSNFQTLRLQLLLIKVLNGPFQALLGIGYAHTRAQETETQCAWAKHVPDAEAQGARPVLEQELIEAIDHVLEIFFRNVGLKQLMVVGDRIRTCQTRDEGFAYSA